MKKSAEHQAELLSIRFSGMLSVVDSATAGQLTVEISPDHSHAVFESLRDDPECCYEQLIDIAGVDYSAYGMAEWATDDTTSRGFSRGVIECAPGRSAGSVQHAVDGYSGASRFAAVYQLLSVSRNERLRVRVFAKDDDLPVIPSVTDVWASANWYEREAFDLFGIVFEGHPDLRRILTDYGFVGFPFRKDFPLIGNVEMRYDGERGRVVYEPVSIEPRVLVPRVIRRDHRYIAES